jgi:predicted DNA-binding transcriptional regulator YafY
MADLLAGKTHDRRTAAASLGVAGPAAIRHLEALVGLPGVKVGRRGRFKTYRFDRSAVLDPPTAADAIAACFGASLGPLFRGTSYDPGMANARNLVLRQSRRAELYNDIERKFLFLGRGGEPSLPEGAPELDEVIEALLHSCWLAFDYTDFNKASRHVKAMPLSLAVYDHQLYVIAQEEGRTPYPYRFARIRKADSTEMTFEYPVKLKYNPDKLFDDSFGIFIENDKYPYEQVRVRLSSRWLTHVCSHRWHRSQEVSTSASEVILSLKLRVCPEVEAWILSFGGEAEVLQPAWLRDKVAGHVRKLAEVYAQAPSPSVVGAPLPPATAS